MASRESEPRRNLRKPSQFSLSGQELQQVRGRISSMGRTDVSYEASPLNVLKRASSLAKSEESRRRKRRLRIGSKMLQFLFKQGITNVGDVYQVTAIDDGLPKSKLRFRIDEDPNTQG